ncbi:Na+/H+ antiporter NhaC family protein [Marinicella gelatinilytica]|uniref:Na+/H+ antiporter NhaC family protein n=1 Tax=Marinicella gelatinilytica TaxID=2996017 RepID=UPI002260ED99|nr:Na+/H+ antiporter NhaC family protein [Marinicella gelatinilytica]MCX7545569.1 sodium:proton antiporter [Marinicella gelatinilytica]
MLSEIPTAVPSAISLIPPVAVLVLAIWLKRPILALTLGALVGLVLHAPSDLLSNFADTSLNVMQDETIAWLILVCGGFGMLIGLLVHTGGAMAFGQRAQRLAKGRKSSLFMTFILGLVIFVDDYLNALSVGESMKRVTDKYKVSREMLAYVVDSTAAPVCVLVPLSTWAIFFGGLLENNQVAAVGEGISVYIQAIPYMLYAWLTLLVVLLVVLGIMPVFGPMKKAEMAAQFGKHDPAQSHAAIDNVAIDEDVIEAATPSDENLAVGEYLVKGIEEEFDEAQSKGKLMNFLVPMVMLVVLTIYFDVDVWKGLIATLMLTLPFYAVQRLMSLAEMMETMMDGFKTMLPAIGTVVAAFIFKDVCDKLMLPQYVIDNLSPYMTAQMLPALVFVSMAVLAFATGSSWGIFAVTIPIVMPLAYAVDANIPLVIGALLSASAFGSQACFYSDSTILAAQGAGCNMVSHAITQLPYALIAATVSFIGFLLLA